LLPPKHKVSEPKPAPQQKHQRPHNMSKAKKQPTTESLLPPQQERSDPTTADKRSKTCSTTGAQRPNDENYE